MPLGVGSILGCSIGDGGPWFTCCIHTRYLVRKQVQGWPMILLAILIIWCLGAVYAYFDWLRRPYIKELKLDLAYYFSFALISLIMWPMILYTRKLLKILEK